MAKFSVGSSHGVVDLRSKKTGGIQLPFSSAPKKKPTLRSRRRKTRVYIALGVLVVLAGIAYGVSYVSYLPQFSVREVNVVGASSLQPPLVQRFVETKLFDGSYSFFSHHNIFLYPRAALEQDIRAFFPLVKSASVSRASMLATTILVKIEERVPYAIWCADSQNVDCYVMDKDGFVFAPTASSSRPETNYFFHGAIAESPIGKRYLSGHLAGIEALLDRLGQGGYNPQEVHAVSDQDFEILLGAGYRLKASFGANGDALLRNLALVLSSESLRNKKSDLEYIDLRFGNRVYYKLKGQEQTSQ